MLEQWRELPGCRFTYLPSDTHPGQVLTLARVLVCGENGKRVDFTYALNRVERVEHYRSWMSKEGMLHEELVVSQVSEPFSKVKARTVAGNRLHCYLSRPEGGHFSVELQPNERPIKAMLNELSTNCKIKKVSDIATSHLMSILDQEEQEAAWENSKLGEDRPTMPVDNLN